MEDPSIWEDPKRAQDLGRERSLLHNIVSELSGLGEGLTGAAELLEMAVEEGDEDTVSAIESDVDGYSKRLEKLEFQRMFSGKLDSANCFVDIQAGAGGTEAQDWAEMLLRMYVRWAERSGMDLEIESLNEGTEAGISSATFLLRGRNAYGWMRSEHGVHRLVRISPFDNNARRQTSFASVKVTPWIDDVDDEIDIDDKDLRIDVYRSSGAGGQHVNVTDSAVRITHLPTGIVTSCQNERSQHQNKDRAMKILKAKLLDLERQKRAEKLAEITGEGAAVDFGSQDRNYVLQPYQQVKDLRSGLELSNPEAVLDGELDDLMEAYLQWVRVGG